MRPRLGPCRRSLRLALGDGPDLISPLPDDVLLLILVGLRCAAAAARTGVLSRRWLGLWSRLRQIVFNDVELPSVEAALGRFPPPPPAVSLLQIRLPMPSLRFPMEDWPDSDTARFRSLLSAAARIDPEELLLVLPSWSVGGSLRLDFPCFHGATSIVMDLCSTIDILCVPDGIGFPALETLSLSHCNADLDSLLPLCPRLRTLRLDNVWLYDTVLNVTSPLLQELVVGPNTWLKHVNILAPMLRQLTMSLRLDDNGVVSFSAPMVEKVSWQCYSCITLFGIWSLMQLSLERAAGEGQLSSLHLDTASRYSWSTIFPAEGDNLAEKIQKHMIIDFSVLELHLTTNGHVYGACVVHLLGINRIRCGMQRLKVSLKSSTMVEGCTPHCPCDSPNWKSQTFSLTSLEQVEINGFGGEDHEFDLLKLILKCAPMLKGVSMKLSEEASASSDKCTKIYDIFGAYTTVECYLYLSCGLMHGSQNCPST